MALRAALSVTLDAFDEGDCDTLFRWANDQEMVKWTRPYRPISAAEHQEWWRGLNKGSTRTMAIRDDGILIGVAQLMGIDPIHRHAEVSIKLAAEARGKGAGPAALTLLIELAVKHLNLQRLFIHVWANNNRAIKAYEKVGFHHEGVMHNHVLIAGERLSVVIMGWP